MAKGLPTELVAEVQDIIDELGSGLIKADEESRKGDVDPGRVNTLFRSAHSLKGLSGMFGLEEITHLAHSLESVLDGMRMGRVPPTPEVFDVLFACVEGFGALIAAAAEGEEMDEARLAALRYRLDQVATGNTPEVEVDPLKASGLGEDVLSVLTEYEEHRLRENLRKGRELLLLRTTFNLADFDQGLEELENSVTGMAEIVTKLPSAEAADPGAISFDIIVGSEVPAGSLRIAISNDKVRILTVTGEEVDESLEAPEASAPADAVPVFDDEGLEGRAGLKSVSQTVRVDIRRLDTLMNLVGELGLIRMSYQTLTDEVRRLGGRNEIAGALQVSNRNFERRLSELQSGIMEVRMVPLGNLFERMVRVGRRMSRELHRNVHIEVEGEATELDKLIVEDLADALMHLIRNAIDHGIEPPEERRAAGKKPEAVLRLSAGARGNHVVVSVSDDGAGINPEKVLAAAVQKGAIAPERAMELTQKEIFNLLFLPGLSTRGSVSEYSGRGVGLDVVKNNIARLSGIIEIESEVGVGTTFTLTLPITLAIIRALIVEVGNQTYAVPLNNVQETIAIPASHIETIERREVISLRGSTVPVIDLRQAFELDATERPDPMYGVVAGVGDARIALVADTLVDQQDIVIKPLGRRFRKLRGIAGATELGNHQVILVVDTVDLLNEMMSIDIEQTAVAR